MPRGPGLKASVSRSSLTGHGPSKLDFAGKIDGCRCGKTGSCSAEDLCERDPQDA